MLKHEQHRIYSDTKNNYPHFSKEIIKYNYLKYMINKYRKYFHVEIL